MADIKEMTIGFSRTINLGNFESARIEASVTVSLDPEDNSDDVLKGMQVDLRTMLEETWKAQLRAKPKEVA
jgi:hypothetical protein